MVSVEVPARPTPDRSIVKRVIEMLSFRAAAMPLAFATTVVTSRLLEPAGRGAYVLGLLTVTIAATLVGGATSVTHEVGRDPEHVREVLGRALVLSLFIGLAEIVVLVPLNSLFAPSGVGVAALFPLGLPLLLIATSVGGAFSALERLRLLNVAQIVPPVMLFVTTLTGVWLLHGGVKGAVVAWVVTQAVAAAVVLVGSRDLWRPLELAGLGFGRSLKFLSLGVRAGIVGLVSLVNYRIELMLLEGFRDLRAVGVYSVAVSLGELLWLVSGTLSAVTVAPALRAETERESAQIVARTVRHTILLSLTAAVSLGAVAVPMIPLVFGAPYRGAVLPLVILLPGVVAYAPASVMSSYFAFRLGKLRYPLVVAGLSAAITGAACVALIPPYGAVGAAVASTIGYAVGGAVLALLFVRRSGLPPRSLVPGRSDLAIYAELPQLIRRRFA